MHEGISVFTLNGKEIRNKVEMGIDGRYQASFLCDDAESFLKRIKEYVMLDNELNEYTKFCIKNTDNFCGCEEVF
ncbi:hypothetical protein NLA42_001015 [Campylobacter jejuni]|uniref:Uncharacterized protein n=2 Tax=Campylobacter jejuni TaxID=197 RepID=A0A5C4YDS3_CAMJU|nr:hypothetical protein [Campylobacter jejuni]EJK3624711.1 hypothetical protein [Campylobacter jejuni]TNO41153.1 hypothetical protein FH034_07055 [Campylobacter jejuni]